jgi:acyl-CoA reductase-like NAD-dependent aldehyde dehydrogenase
MVIFSFYGLIRENVDLSMVWWNCYRDLGVVNRNFIGWKSSVFKGWTITLSINF